MRKFLLFFAACFAFAFSQPAWAENDGPILTGKVNPTVTRSVPLPFNAVVEEVLVRPGEAIQAGAPLMRYHLQDEALRMLERELTTGANTENLRSQMLTLESELATARAERNKTRHLVSSGLGSKQALGRLDENVASLNNRIELLKATISKAEKNFEMRLKELSGYFDQEIKENQPLPASLVLKSPISGYVLSLDQGANPGQLMNAGFSPLQVGQIDPVIIRVPVYETDLNNIKIGDAATVEIPSLRNRQFKGEVTEISWISTDMNVANPSYYLVELTVPNPELLMKPGFKAIARFNSSSSR